MKNISTSELGHLKELYYSLNEIVTVIDKIGSGFPERERLAIALLLFFKERKALDKLANIRGFLLEELENNLTEEEFDDIIEKELPIWNPPYKKSQKELLDALDLGSGNESC